MRRRYVGIAIATLIAFVVVVALVLPTSVADRFARAKVRMHDDATALFYAVDLYGTTSTWDGTPPPAVFNALLAFRMDFATMQAGVFYGSLEPLPTADETCRRGLAAASGEVAYDQYQT
jgi:hypothetical protein